MPSDLEKAVEEFGYQRSEGSKTALWWIQSVSEDAYKVFDLMHQHIQKLERKVKTLEEQGVRHGE